MISRSRKCIFVHIPKTGGTSVEDLIWPDKTARTEGELWGGLIDKHRNKYQTGGLQHLLARQILLEVGKEEFSGCFSFAMVRNPWDKAVSQYIFMDKREDLRQIAGMKKGDSFKKYLSLIPKKTHVQWAPQIDFTHDANGGQLVNYIGRFESFAETVHHVLGVLGMQADAIPHEKRGSRRPYQEYYDAEAREMLGEMYAADIDTFAYAFDDSHVVPSQESTGTPIAGAGNSRLRPWSMALDIVDRLRRRTSR